MGLSLHFADGQRNAKRPVHDVEVCVCGGGAVAGILAENVWVL